jgi:hypothetical protein
VSERRAGQRKLWLVAAAVLAAIAGTLGWLHVHRGAPAAGPLAAGPLGSHLLPSPVSFDGRVVERLDAGPYAYLRVARDGAGDAWVVSMVGKPHPGDRVHVDAVGRADHFDSARLGRRFDDLWFAAVRTSD